MSKYEPTVPANTQMTYNPEASTHRGRVIESNTLLHQIKEAHIQAANKVEAVANNLVPGIQATANPIVVGNQITSIIVTNPGSEYKFPPLVTIISGGGQDATAVAVLDSIGGVENITVTNVGSGYIGLPVVNIASSTTDATPVQRQQLYNQYLDEFLQDIGKPFDIIPATFSRGRLSNAYITPSASTITNPLYVPGGANFGIDGMGNRGNRRIESRVPCPEGPQLVIPSNPPECWTSIHNTGKMPSEESRYTHTLRVDRNDNAIYIIAQTWDSVENWANKIVLGGGTVTQTEKQIKFDELIEGAFNHLQPNWNEKPSEIKNSLYDPNSATVIENDRFARNYTRELPVRLNKYIPKENPLPEFTLKSLPDNMQVHKYDDQKRISSRAQSDMISVAIESRYNSTITFNQYMDNQNPTTLKIARDAFQKAIKSTAAAYAAKRWLPSDPSTIMGYKNILYP